MTVSRQQLFEWLAGVFQTEASAITEAAGKDTLANWDSMAMLLLIAELDDKLKLVLTEAELASLNTVADIVALVRGKGVEITG